MSILTHSIQNAYFYLIHFVHGAFGEKINFVDIRTTICGAHVNV